MIKDKIKILIVLSSLIFFAAGSCSAMDCKKTETKCTFGIAEANNIIQQGDSLNLKLYLADRNYFLKLQETVESKNQYIGLQWCIDLLNKYIELEERKFKQEVNGK